MKRNLTGLAGVAAACVLGFGMPAQARIGVAIDASPAFSMGNYLSTKGVDFQNGVGFNGRAALILGNWFLGYDYTQFGNAQACSAGQCFQADNMGSTRFHAFTAMYNFFFLSGPVKPYLAVGLGAIIGTLGGWSTSQAPSNVFGGDFRASFGLEFGLGSKFFLRVEGRYRYILTNNPIQNLQQDLAVGLLLGDPGASAREIIQDAHIVQAVVGFGAHF